MTPAEAAAVLSPLAWAKLYLPDAVPDGFAPFHRRLVSLPEPGESEARIVYRGASKTTLTRMMVIHAAQHRKVRGVILVRNTYGDVRLDSRAIQTITPALGASLDRDPDARVLAINGVPIWLRTPGSAVRGLQWTAPNGEVIRPDTAIIDDLETRESARSASRTDELGRWLEADVMGTAGQKHPMRTVLLGTPITPTSLVAKAMRREGMFAKWLPPFVVPIVDRDQRPAWPDVYDPQLRDRISDDAWATEYMLEPLPSGSLVFPPDRTVWVSTIEPWPVYVAVDPAGDGDDATGIVAVANTPHGLVVVDAVQYTGPAEDMPDRVGAFVRKLQTEGHRVLGVSVEAVGGWVFAANQIATKVHPVPCGHESPMVSKLERALPVTLWHRTGAVGIADRLRGSPFDLEWHTWTRDGHTVTGHDDCIDAGVWAMRVATGGFPPNLPVPATSLRDAA